MNQFRKDADVLLAPFKNRIPAGVKGLDAVLTEYVALKDADERRRSAVRNNPVAAKMYACLEECAAGVVPTELFDASVVASDPPRPVPIAPAPPRSTPTTTNAVRGHPAASALMPPPPARSPHKKKRGGAAPRRNPAHAVPTGGLTAAPTAFGSPRGAGGEGEVALGSLDDEGGWRQFNLPPELGDDRVQNKLAELIAGNMNTNPSRAQEGSPSGGKVSADVAAGGSIPAAGAALANASIDVDQVVASLFVDGGADDELAHLLAPLLNPQTANGTGNGNGGTPGSSRGRGARTPEPSPLGSTGKRAVEGSPRDAARAGSNPRGASTDGKRRRKSARVDTSAGVGDGFDDPPGVGGRSEGAVGGGALPPELRGMDLDGLLHEIHG